MPASASVPITWSVFFSRGSNTSAVNVFSVLAGRNFACGAFAASTWPVSRSATTYEDAWTAGGVAPVATTVGFAVISAPPTGPCSAAVAVSGCATTSAVVAQAVRSKRIGGSLDARRGRRHLTYRFRSRPVRGPHVADPGALPRRVLVVARVVRVVHVVVDRVETRQRAGVPAGRATARRAALRRGVTDRVVRARAATLERVVEPEPVPGLVRRRLAQVEVRRRTTRQRAVLHPDPVDARVRRVVPRERRDPEVAEVDQPDVQRVLAALAGLRPVRRTRAVPVPGVVVVPVGPGQREREPGVRGLAGLSTGEVLVQLRDLLVDLGRGDITGTRARPHHVDVHRHRGRRQLAGLRCQPTRLLGLQQRGGLGLDRLLLRNRQIPVVLPEPTTSSRPLSRRQTRVGGLVDRQLRGRRTTKRTESERPTSQQHSQSAGTSNERAHKASSRGGPLGRCGRIPRFSAPPRGSPTDSLSPQCQGTTTPSEA